ncbi:MAG: hypothetical protein H8M99_04145 [Gloeobacteraceae cyanobacterium ES-bin-144]|nr:hypothetical protein [Verrucomicrobiales bacterium]
MNPEPPPVPTLSKASLWTVLSIPTLLTLIGNVIVHFTSGDGDYGSNYLVTPMVMFFVILILTPFFNHVVRSRYRGRSLVFLNFGFILGQMMVCLAVWFGSCLLLIS